MSRQLTVQPRAQSEIDAAFDWYEFEKQRPDLARDLLAEARAVFNRIREQPDLYAIVYGPGRRAGLKRFPYAVYYISADDAVTVVAFLHDRQSRDVHLAKRF